jgi:hypothetical protein
MIAIPGEAEFVGGEIGELIHHGSFVCIVQQNMNIAETFKCQFFVTGLLKLAKCMAFASKRLRIRVEGSKCVRIIPVVRVRW